jgi:hypothetical protein
MTPEREVCGGRNSIDVLLRINRKYRGEPVMEYGDAVNGHGLDQAIVLAREESRRYPDQPLEKIAAEAVAHAFCVCVTDGQVAAEGRISGLHRTLVEQVTSRLREDPGQAPGRSPVPAAGERNRR